MAFEKMKFFDRKSLYVKEFMSLIIASIVIFLCMEVTSVYYLNLYKKRTVENYQNSLELYCSYWDSELDTINNALVSMTSAVYDDYYFNVCTSDDRLVLETSKVILMKQMAEIARTHSNHILVFTYIPERSIYLKSTNSLVEIAQRGELDKKIQSYSSSLNRYNTTVWDYFESGDNKYLINVYKVNNGFVGAVIDCNTILTGLVKEEDIVLNTAFTNKKGNTVYELKSDVTDNQKASSSFSVGMKHLNYNIEIKVVENKLFSDFRFLLYIGIGVIIVGIIVMSLIAQFQMKIVLNPLNRLKKGMESFSQGNLNLRLEEDTSSNEIKTLYKTFNNMAEQITNLKIEVYEFELERQKIQSDFLRVQIQPHFYTNIINLFYGLAEMRDYVTIQKLAKMTAGYFRYLLGEKGTFVLLREEINCIRNYAEIQKLRYSDCFDMILEAEDEMNEQLILPMVLQTFVENCIKHNITLVPVLEVRIQMRIEDKQLVMQIRDNGIGFPEDMLRKLNSNENISKDGEHIGIMNVKERFKMFYQESASIKITSVPGDTRILIRMPQILPCAEKKN